jgi:hypothetical protein
MDHKLLVVTFQDDLKQFTMFCHCLNKNWQSNKNLIVVVGKNTDKQQVEKIIKQTLSSEWMVEIKDTIWPHQIGWIEQQINKIFYSVTSNTHDVIVFDSKDFMIRPCDFSVFKKQEKHRVTYFLRNQKLVDIWPNLENIVDKEIKKLPAVLNLTPWIWNVQQLTKYWDHINKKFGPYNTWKDFPAGTEIYGYYIFTWTDPDSNIKFLDPFNTPLLVGGGWADQTHQDMLIQVEEFDRESDRCIWKHNRRLQDLKCVEVTKSQLSKYGIDKSIIDQVFENYSPATRSWG